MEPQRFAARWSVSTWIITSAVIVLLACVAGTMIWSAAHETRTVLAWALVAGVMLLSILVLVTLLFAPTGYVVSDDAVVFRRIGGNVVIRLEQVREVRPIHSREIGFVLRVFGSGGFFGWFGQFYGRQLGFFTAYCSNTKGLVLITLTNGSRMIISPSPAGEFLEAMESAGRART
jgi:hypothetical protein